MTRLALLSTTFFILTTMIGCGGKQFGQVAGKVVWSDGTPASEIADAQVVFDSQVNRIAARGIVKSDGTFTIFTEKPEDGALVGDYDVLILEHRPAAEGTTTLPPQKIMDKYCDFKTSGLKATIKPGKNELTLTLERMPNAKNTKTK